MSQHRLFYFMELKEPKAACGLFPSLSWCCYRVEWRPGQKFHDTHRDVGDGVIEVWQDRFVLAGRTIQICFDCPTLPQPAGADCRSRYVGPSWCARCSRRVRFTTAVTPGGGCSDSR
jgi:hypothetical protein